ncbi:MAG: hypothetical protein CVU16_02105 [Betaproteobacteria bacterium HGW-Betaproteobacteria-10]|nr:MAG: hypothetical protein CVU16_02105 [Betaproteobacteria bacterium HGW-Betaproteobacteria-10]
MIQTAAIVGFLALLALLVFVWRQSGFGSGRKFGNRIASHVGIPKSLFYTLLDNGAKGSSRDLLISLENSELDLDQASVELGPSLSRGIERLEARFGPQEMYDRAKPTVARLTAEFERKQQASAT